MSSSKTIAIGRDKLFEEEIEKKSSSSQTTTAATQNPQADQQGRKKKHIRSLEKVDPKVVKKVDTPKELAVKPAPVKKVDPPKELAVKPSAVKRDIRTTAEVQSAKKKAGSKKITKS